MITDLFGCNGKDLRVVTVDGEVFEGENIYVTTEYELNDMAYGFFPDVKGGKISLYEDDLVSIDILGGREKGWLPEDQLKHIALNKLHSWFSEEYLRKNKAYIVYQYSNNVFIAFVGVKRKKDYPFGDMECEGWSVYGLVMLSAITGEFLPPCHYQPERY